MKLNAIMSACLLSGLAACDCNSWISPEKWETVGRTQSWEYKIEICHGDRVAVARYDWAGKDWRHEPWWSDLNREWLLAAKGDALIKHYGDYEDARDPRPGYGLNQIESGKGSLPASDQ